MTPLNYCTKVAPLLHRGHNVTQRSRGVYIIVTVATSSTIGAHKTIITGPKGKSLHKEELTMSQAERDVHHRIKSNAPLQQRHASNRSLKTMAPQDISKTSHKNITQGTISKIPETTSDIQDTKVRS